MHIPVDQRTILDVIPQEDRPLHFEIGFLIGLSIILGLLAREPQGSTSVSTSPVLT